MRVLSFTEAADTIKSSLDIVDIISRHVVLKKAGRNYLGLCPFHPEKTPSFNVNREKNLYKCFGCGEAGDALGFLMNRENKTYGEVIRELAAEQGIEVLQEGHSKEQASQQRDLNQKIFHLNETSHAWFQQALQGQSPDAASVRGYLEKRQLTPELIQRFGLGFAPPGWENLTRYLTHQVDFAQSNPDLLVNAGLANHRTEGQGYYDRFRNRLIIPIHDDQGRVVGFGGRALSDEDKPKYLNSPETPVYVKSRILYGLYQAKETIRQHKSAVVMEGYFDVIAAHWGGITQAVGSCGTALTEGHLKLLTRFGAETVYLAFDSDEAGLKAASSAIELIEPYLASANLNLKIVVVPSGKDPDEFIRQAGGAAFQTLMHEAKSYLDFKFEMALRDIDVYTAEGRVRAANRITPILANIRQPILRSELLRKYADRLNLSEEALSLEIRRYERIQYPERKSFLPDLQNFSKKKAISKHPRTSLKSNTPRWVENTAELRQPLAPRHTAAEKFLLKLLLMHAESYPLMLPVLQQLSFTDSVHRRIVEAVREVSEHCESLNAFLQAMSARLADDKEAQRVFSDLAFTAESLQSSLGLEGLTSGVFRDKVLREAEKYRGILEAYQQQENLRQLAKQARDLEYTTQPSHEEESELSMLELQYQIREKLFSDRVYQAKDELL